MFASHSVCHPNRAMCMSNLTCRVRGSSAHILTSGGCAMSLCSTGGGRAKGIRMQAGNFNSFDKRFILPSPYLANCFDLHTTSASIDFGMRRCGHPAFSIAFRPIGIRCRINSSVRIINVTGAFTNTPIRGTEMRCGVSHSCT